MKIKPTLLAVLLLAGCASTLNREPVARQSFLIQLERPAGPAARAAAATLQVSGVEVAAPFEGRGLVYRRDDVRFETDFYNEFATEPAQMVAEAAVAWLGASGLFQQVLAPRAGAASDLRLEANVSALYVDFRQEPPAAVLNLRWQVLRTRDRGSLLEIPVEERMALAERSPAGAVRAYRQALEQALARLEAGLAAAQLN